MYELDRLKLSSLIKVKQMSESKFALKLSSRPLQCLTDIKSIASGLFALDGTQSDCAVAAQLAKNTASHSKVSNMYVTYWIYS